MNTITAVRSPNSDLTALKEQLYPRPQYGDREAAFYFGSIVDALITEPTRVDLSTNW